ncbi:hypothetical protein JXA80_04165 [bacterium]|nr:hypothetical protein [candidate division CSSED10-310 bacterium]
MKPVESRRLPVTLSFFSPVGIVFTFREGMSLLSIGVAIVGTFIAILGLTDIITGIPGNTGLAIVMFITGSMVLGRVVFVRSRATEISILDPRRQITGIPGIPYPVGFSDIDRLFLDQADNAWRIFMVMKDGRQIILVHGYPLNLARKIALHTAHLIGVPVLGDHGQILPKSTHLDWSLHCRMPRGLFPLEYLLLAASLAASVVIVAGINLNSIFHPELAPKWMLLLALAIPGGHLISSIQEYRGFKWAFALCCLFFSGLVMLTVLGLNEPASVCVALIPAGVVVMLTIVAYTERKRIIFWIIMCLVFSVPGFGMAVFASYQYHTFFNLDPAVIQSVDVTLDTGRRLAFSAPNDIRGLIRALQKGSIRIDRINPRSAELKLAINRPAGRDFYIELFREGAGNRTQAVYRLSCEFFGFRYPLGLVASSDMEHALSAEKAVWAIWPPRY